MDDIERATRLTPRRRGRPMTDYRARSFPDVAQSMHGTRPDLYVETVLDWVTSLDP